MKLILALSLVAGLAACGDQKTGATTKKLPKEDVAAAEIERFQAAQNARSRITMIDAASGDAAAMPGEWSGPTAYDLRGRENGSTPASSGDSDKAQPDVAKPPATEAFPSVAE